MASLEGWGSTIELHPRRDASVPVSTPTQAGRGEVAGAAAEARAARDLAVETGMRLVARSAEGLTHE